MSTANNKPAESVSLNAFKQPRAFYLIFSIELWERFGYYGLQGIMAVYLVKQLGMSEADSITLFSSFSALVYGLVAIGGWLGDKVLGTKRVIMLGAIVLAIGYALVAEAIRFTEAQFPGQGIRIGAQAHLQKFYGSLGFEPVGETYDEDGIAHIDMVKPAR